MPSGRTVQPRILLLAVPVLAMLAYSHDAIFARLATADPLVVAAGRFAAAALALWPLALLRERAALRRLGLTDLLITAAAGALLALDFTTWIAATQLTSVANSLLLTNVGPFWAIIFSVRWLGRKLRPADLAVGALSIAGASIITHGSALGAAGGSLAGDLLALASSLPSAGFLVLTVASAHRLPTLTYLTLTWSWAALMLAAASLLTGAELPREMPVLGAILAMALVGQLVGHGLITWSLRWLSPCYVAVYCLAEPLLGVFWGRLYFGEQAGPFTLVGGSLILLGIYLGIRHETTQPADVKPVPGPQPTR
jgi:drug/metabolite transporter (DMT)-like permease